MQPEKLTPALRACACVFSIVMRLVVACIILALLTSCSPYLETPGATPTAEPTARSTVTHSPQRKPTVIKAPTPYPTCTVRTGVPAGAVNLRTGAGMRYAVVRVLSEGDVLKVVKRAAWLQVIDEAGNRGFINARYCK